MTGADQPRRSWRAEYLALAASLVAARHALVLSQDRVSARIGVGRRTFQRWEAGEASPDAMQLFRWADIVGISITSAPNLAQSIAA